MSCERIILIICENYYKQRKSIRKLKRRAKVKRKKKKISFFGNIFHMFYCLRNKK